ncbi:MAG: MobC family plasmid mobilization relaxosome protein [Eubacterium sp.]
MVITISKEKKSERINLHLTPTDKSIIKDKADKLGMNMTNYLTACAVVEKIYCVGDKESFDEIIYQLKKIGNNINQIRMLANFGNIQFANLDECTNALLEVNKSIQKIIKRTSRWQP